LLFAAVSNEGTIWVWDIEKREPILLVIEATEGCSVEAIMPHPNGQWLLCGGVDYLSTSGTTGNVCLWDLPAKQRLFTVPDGATCLTFDPSGDRFAFATPEGRIIIADSASGKIHLDIEGRDGEVMNALVFSPESSLLIGAARDATLRVWDSGTGELIASRQLNVPIHSLFVEPDGRLFAGNENATGCEIALARLCDLA
jgi:WD40 repeat protein